MRQARVVKGPHGLKGSPGQRKGDGKRDLDRVVGARAPWGASCSSVCLGDRARRAVL